METGGGAHGCVGPTQLTCARVFKILCPYGFELTRLTLVLTPACGPWYGKRIKVFRFRMWVPSTSRSLITST